MLDILKVLNKRLRTLSLVSVVAILLGLTHTVNANEAFVFEVKDELKTVGDIKPAFIVYQDKPLPKVSINYVLKRYIKLFETANSPSVKIDALNRINNLRAKYKLESKKLSISNVEQSKVVLDSYDRIVDSGVFYQRMDELLYQTAKASKFIGNDEDSIKRLKLLVGLYPRSELVDESMFRMGESYFDLEEYAKAEAQYKKVLTFAKSDLFHQRANFKLGWSVFRQDRFTEAGVHISKVLNDFPKLRKAIDYSDLEGDDFDLVQDSFRLFSILFSKEDGAKSIENLQKKIGHTDYAFLLYDSLFRMYLGQERYLDAGRVARAFTDNYPVDFNAHIMAQNEMKTYKKGEFDINLWETKENFAKQFGVHSDYWKSLNNEQLQVIKPQVTEVLSELAHLYYVKMQTAYQADKKSKKGKAKGTDEGAKSSSYRALGKTAADYYLELVETRGNDRYNGENLFLAAEALYKIGEYRNSIEVYERAAYEYPGHARATEAGYAAVLSYDKLMTKGDDGYFTLSQQDKSDRRMSIERFAKFFPLANQTPALLNDLAHELFEEENYKYASDLAQKVVEARSADAKIRYSSWQVYAHSHFELENFALAEHGYRKLVAFAKNEDLKPLNERLAASIYKQAEVESSFTKSAELYLKVVDAVPNASIAPQSLYDASAQFLKANRWQQAIASLSVYQDRFPKHEYYQDASDKLVYAYEQNNEPVSAAEKLVQISNETKDKEKASNSLFRAAEIYEANEFKYEAVKLYAAYIKLFPENFGLVIESHQHNIDYYSSRSELESVKAWQEKLVAYEKRNSSQRNARSSFLAANSALALVEPDIRAFENITLTLPLKKSLAKKKEAMKKLIKKLESLSKYEVAEVMSASTYKIAEIYRSLAQNIMASERPDKLTALQLEQYDILLEEQAYSFEEQAFEIYQINLDKVPDGEYDIWIRKTFDVLAEMNPTEFRRQPKEVSHAEEFY